MTRFATFLATIAFIVVLVYAGVRPAQANTTNCYLATSEAAHTLCFLDFGGYSLANGSTTAQSYPFTIKLPDGSLVSGTITNSGPAIGAAANNPTVGVTMGIVTIPTLKNSALGNYSATTVAAGDATSTTYEGGYLGVGGNPAFYQNNTVGPIALGNISLTDSTGASEGSTIAIAAADAEDTAAADTDGGTGGIYWSTTGGNLAEVQLLNQLSTTKSICTFTLNAQTATCLPTAATTDPGSAYILSSQLTAASQAFTVKSITTNVSGEAFAFAFRLGTLNVAKTVGGRLGTDQFKVAVTHGTATAFSATTTGTTTGTASTVTAGGAAVPGVAYTLTDTTTSGSNPISEYATTWSCLNSTTNTTTTGSTQTVSVTPVTDQTITCTFTNNGLQLTNTPVNATSSDPGSTSETDSFTLKNTSGIAGTFVVGTPTIAASSGGAPTPSGYTFGGTTYTTLAALNAAIAAAGTTAAGGTITVGVTYTTSTGSSTGATSDTVTLPATVTSGTGTSATTSATETDTVPESGGSTTGTNCYIATGANQHLICWLDFTGYPGVGSETFSLKMPDGSVLTGTVTNTGSSSYAIDAAPVIAGVALGSGTYTGIAGKPVFYQSNVATKSPIELSNLQLTDPNGYAVTTIGMGAADAERTDSAGTGEVLSWSTSGASFTNLQLMQTSPTTTNVCTLSALGANVTCTGATTDPVEGYLLRSILNTTTSGSASTISMADTTTASEGFAFGIDLSLLTATKTVANRVATADQFTVNVTRGTNGAATPAPIGTPFASASTTGTGTTASATTPYYVIPNDTYVFSESMASGSTSALSQYATTVTCTNAMPTTGVTQVLPAANTSAQSVAIIPQPDAEITCAFTNYGLILTNTPVAATASDPGGTSETDSFTLKNTSGIAGTFVVGTPTITSSAGDTPVPSGYTFGGTTYTSLSALNAAIAAAGTTAAGGTITVGVVYTTSAGSSSSTTTDTVQVPATITSGTGTSAAATGTEVDTLPELPASTSGTQCYVATGANQHLICWLDFTGYSGVGSETFSLKMPDGSTLTGTVNNTGTAKEPPAASPLYTGTSFGNSFYTGVKGKPIFDVTDTTTNSPIVISNLKLTDPNGFSVSTVGMVGADGEDTDGTIENLTWTTTGNAWTVLQLMTGSSPTTSVCTLSPAGGGGQTEVCQANNTGPPAEAYVLRSIVNTITGGAGQQFSMAAVSPSQEGLVYGIDLSLLTATKTITNRIATADQFTMAVSRATNVAVPQPTGSPVASSTSTGTATSVTATTPFYVIPNENYVFAETMASGSSSALSQYATTVTCTNAMPTTGVTQVLPAANTSAQSVVVVPQPDSEITCAFTNYGMILTNTAVTPTATVTAGSTQTDSFTLKNTGGIAGTFTVAQPTIVSGGTSLAPSATTAAYILNNAATGTCSVATPCTLANLNSAIAAAGQTAINGTIVVGVQYSVPSTAGAVITATLPATIANGTGTSAQATATETDTVPGLAIAKTGTTSASPGGLVAYTLTVTNPSGIAESGAVVTDPLPTGVTFKSASCTASSTAACAAPTSAVAGGVTTVSDTITTLPVGGSATITIYASAGAAGTVTNQATVTPPSGTGGGAQTSSVVTTTIAQANGITKTVTNLTHTQYNTGAYNTTTNNSGLPGDTLQYTLSFTNNTGAAIGNLAFTDNLPAQVTYVSTSCSSSSTPLPCSATPAGTPTTYTFTGSLAVGATATITINVKIK